MVFDKTGSLANVKRHDYLPFGEELSAGQGVRTTTLGYGAADGVRQKFTSQERDNETGLDYMHARYFASAQGRFTSADSVAGSTSNPQSLNRYAYVGNNPLNFSDPTGHMPSIHLNPKPGQDGGEDGYSYSWDDPTSPQAVLQAAGILPSDIIGSTQINDFPAEHPEKSGSKGDSSVGGTEGKAGGASASVDLTDASLGTPAGSVDPLTGTGTRADRIARIAAANVGGEEWRTSKSRRARRNKKVVFGKGSNKCNLFVYEVLLAAGISPPTSGGKGKWPVRAEEWADSSIGNLNGWEIVEGEMQAGDVVALARWSIFSTTEASGHVAIAVSSNQTVGTGRDDGRIVRGSFGSRWYEYGVVVRRYVGKGN
jgi:RHS repeat-associated protein